MSDDNIINFKPKSEIDAEIRIRIKNLSPDSDLNEITELLNDIAEQNYSPLKKERFLSQIQALTNSKIGVLKVQLKNAEKNYFGDIPHAVAKIVLDKYFANGKHLVHATDGYFWSYDGKYWQRIADKELSKKVLAVVNVMAFRRDYQRTVKAALELLISMQTTETDVFRFKERPHPVINCANGEVWFDERGNVEFRAHRYDSYLRYVLTIEYDPHAVCPKFEQALLDIFVNSKDPYKLRQHLYEIIGYQNINL